MPEVEDVKSLRVLFNAVTLMAGVCGFATAATLYNSQDPRVPLFMTAVTGAGMAFGLWQMARTGYEIRKQGETILERRQPE